MKIFWRYKSKTCWWERNEKLFFSSRRIKTLYFINRKDGLDFDKNKPETKEIANDGGKIFKN